MSAENFKIKLQNKKKKTNWKETLEKEIYGMKRNVKNCNNLKRIREYTSRRESLILVKLEKERKRSEILRNTKYLKEAVI